MIADFLTKPLQGKAFVKFLGFADGSCLIVFRTGLYFNLDFRFGALLKNTGAPQKCVGEM